MNLNLPQNLMLISIVLPTYNRVATLPRAIETIVGQTYTDWELIIVDNCSTDGTHELLSSYQDKRIKFIRVRNRGNISLSLNAGVRESRGGLIAFQNSDDWWALDKLEKQAKLFQNDSVDIVYGNYAIAQKNQAIVPRFKTTLPEGQILDEMLKSYQIGIITAVIRKTVIEDLPVIFNERYKLIGDFDLMMRLANRCRFRYVHDVVAFYRLHDHNETKTQGDLMLAELETWLEESESNQELVAMANFPLRKSSIRCARGVQVALQGRPWNALQVYPDLARLSDRLKLFSALCIGFQRKILGGLKSPRVKLR